MSDVPKQEQQYYGGDAAEGKTGIKKRMLPANRTGNPASYEYAINDAGEMLDTDDQQNELMDGNNGSSDELIIAKKKVRIIPPSHHLMVQFPLRH